MSYKPTKYDFKRTEKLNNLRVEFLHLKIKAQTVKTDSERQRLNIQAEAVFEKIILEGAKVYRGYGNTIEV